MVNVSSFSLDTHRYGNVTYLPNPQHRDGNPNKSQWLIDIDHEINVFKCMDRNSWGSEENGWGLFINNNGSLNYLGVIQARNIEVFIAKFVTDKNHNAWHGYPADYQFKAQDVPDKSILLKWKEENFLTKSIIRKIMKGQPCKI
ncbi:MAG TPA: hypothetical protein VIF37_09845 [Methylobacter sp.]